ncbi:MAG: tRNA epoxyqueuosine(34) reductase QueG [Alphaproteobacteria bacterium]|nr:tRNA epoxyqueuosine(34) reductase QueG [Alphaproteobacteria bacterium]
MPISTSDTARLRAKLDAKAKALGFDALGIAAAETPGLTGRNLHSFVALERHGTMAWLAETADRRESPKALWPEAKSAVVVAMNYGPDSDPLVTLGRPDAATISVYARNRDYHDIIKGRLKELAAQVAKLTGGDVKVFVDTAPLMEKPLARLAGLGWQGKHTNLVSRDFGSWLFLGVILTAAEFAPDQPADDSCGSCRACLDACPTAAFPAPYQIDARRCISYLTIEHAGPIDAALRPLMGNRIYGCDDCLAVCPWNKFAQTGHEAKLAARDDLRAPALAQLARLDDAAFRSRFTGSPIKRIGRDRFVRNVLIAIGNSGDAALAASAEALLNDAAPGVRAMAVWACRRLMPHGEVERLRGRWLPHETDADVRAEWAAA